MALDIYRHYFDIDPDYFPAVNESVINNNPDMWKKYYPHATFVKLIKDTVVFCAESKNIPFGWRALMAQVNPTRY